MTDFTPYGLDKPEATIELTTPAQPDGPLVLQVGKLAPGQSRPRLRPPRATRTTWRSSTPGSFPRFPRDSIAFRAQHVAEIDPAAVCEIQIEALKPWARPSTLARKGNAWELSVSPDREGRSLTLCSRSSTS